MGSDDDVIRSGDHLAVLRRHWLLIVVMVVLGGSAGFALSSRQSTAYDAEAKVLVASSSSVDPGAPMDPEQVATEAELVLSDPLVEEVAATLPGSLTRDELEEAVTVEVGDGTSVLVIRARQPTADGAAALANAFATEYVRFRADQARSARKFLTSQIEALQADIDEVRTTLPSLAPGPRAVALGTLTDLSARQSDLEARLLIAQTAEAAQSGGRVLTAATPASTPAQPRPLLAVALGMAIGLVVGLVGAYLRNGGVRGSRT